MFTLAYMKKEDKQSRIRQGKEKCQHKMTIQK